MERKRQDEEAAPQIAESGNGNSNQAEPKKKYPYLRVRNASIFAPMLLANRLESETPENPIWDGFGYSFFFPVLQPPYPDTNVEGFINIRRYRDTVCIWVSAKHIRSNKEHAVVISPPEASKEEVIQWLRDENNRPLLEQTWWDLFRDAEPD